MLSWLGNFLNCYRYSTIHPFTSRRIFFSSFSLLLLNLLWTFSDQSFCDCVCFYFCWVSQGRFMLNFMGIFHMVLQNDWTVFDHISNVISFNYTISWEIFVISFFLFFNYSFWWVWNGISLWFLFAFPVSACAYWLYIFF